MLLLPQRLVPVSPLFVVVASVVLLLLSWVSSSCVHKHGSNKAISILAYSLLSSTAWQPARHRCHRNRDRSSWMITAAATGRLQILHGIKEYLEEEEEAAGEEHHSRPTHADNDDDVVVALTETETKALSSSLSSLLLSKGQGPKDRVLEAMALLRNEADRYAHEWGLSRAEAALYALCKALRTVQMPLLNVKGQPLVLRQEETQHALQPQSPPRQPKPQERQQEPQHPHTRTTMTTNECDWGWAGLFTLHDLEKAVHDDFLDAARGSTDHRKGWKITGVSQPRGDTFEEARMRFEDVQAALQRGTVIVNAAGAHIPKLAGPALACTDATCLPCALNVYVTRAGMQTSAPPHTDKQDVAIAQMTGRKRWQVFSPPIAAQKPWVDPFARGKGDDHLPLYSLLLEKKEKKQLQQQQQQKEEENDCRLLLDEILSPGDALFIPAGFPHTTSTNIDDSTAEEQRLRHQLQNHALIETSSDTNQSSIHLTLGIDHHIWNLDYLSARRIGLLRAGLRHDPAFVTTTTTTTTTSNNNNQNHMIDNDNDLETHPFVGKVNELPLPLWQDILAELPLGFLEDDDTEQEVAVKGRKQKSNTNSTDGSADYLQIIVNELKDLNQRIAEATNTTAVQFDDATQHWTQVALRLQQEGRELLNIHREMYLAALDEGRKRDAEDAMQKALLPTMQMQQLQKQEHHHGVMTEERMRRLSVFRVKLFYDRIQECKTSLKQWSVASHSVNSYGHVVNNKGTLFLHPSSPGQMEDDEDWAFTLPISEGVAVEADLGGAFFPAKVTRVSSSSSGVVDGSTFTFDVQFFDGDIETGLKRSQIKLLSRPSCSSLPCNPTKGGARDAMKAMKTKKIKKKKMSMP